MRSPRRAQWSLLAQALVFILLLAVDTSRLEAGEAERAVTSVEPVTGQLVIEGRGIERLTLEKRGAKWRFGMPAPRELHRPGPKVSLAAGEYRVTDVRLEGGYRCCPPQRIGDPQGGEPEEVGWFTVGPDKPHVLRIGAPLKPTLRVARDGRILRMAYDLMDASAAMGWYYVPEQGWNGPMAHFTVSCRGQVVGSGTLGAYG